MTTTQREKPSAKCTRDEFSRITALPSSQQTKPRQPVAAVEISMVEMAVAMAVVKAVAKSVAKAVAKAVAKVAVTVAVTAAEETIEPEEDHHRATSASSATKQDIGKQKYST